MAGTYLTSESLLPDRSFNWAFLVELLVCGILTVFFLFYFNRLFATLVSYGVRAYTWHKYRAYIDAQALQISLLGGRVFFKGLRYHGQNQTVLVHSGYVTWRYWLRKVRTVDCDTNHPSTSSSESSAATDHGPPRTTPRASFAEKGGRAGSNPLPCRIEVTLKGLEWFIYNRSPAYDAVLRAVSKDGSGGNDATGSVSGGPSPNTRNNTSTDQGHGPAHKGSSASDEEYETAFGAPRAGLYSDEKQDPSLPPTDKPDSVQPDLTGHASSAPSVTSNTIKSEADQSTFLSLLPVHVDCHVGAIVMGNEHTKCILVTKFERTKGEIDATSSGPLDSYKQLINFRFVHPVIQMKPNPDYKEPLLSGDAQMERLGASDPATMNEKNQPEHNQRRNPRLWRGVRNVEPLVRKCVSSLSPKRRKNTPAKQDIPGPSVTDNRRWLGLTRYLDEIQQEEREGWGSVEYAKFSTLADCPVVTMSFYWDVAGVVPQAVQTKMESIIESDPDINGDLPPEWGIDLSVGGGVIHYGPWTDRQRAELQAMFFPSLYRNATPASRLSAGTARVSTLLKIFIEFDDQTILRIPTRESSKDWKWKGRAENSPAGPLRQKEKQKKSGKTKKGGKGVPGPDVRPFGWLDVKVMPDSTVKYLMDLVAGRSGYHNTLALDFRGTEMSSSVNHGLLLRSDRQEISCDLSNPLEWNGLRIWKFDIICNALELFLLRDHVFLLTDLVNDWGSGPSSDYYTFIPFQYLMQLRLPDFQLLLNANDSNIINSPADFDDNTYLNIWGGDLAANVMIPLDNFSPVQNEVSFELDAHHGGFKLHAPPWNTQHTFLDSINVASLVDLVITGRYNYYTTAFPNLTDTCILDVHGTTLSVQLYGFLIRYLMKIKDNYFGDDIHFRTFEEFRLITKQSRQLEEPDASSPLPRKANDMDVILTISASETSALLPANLYSCRHSVKLDITSLAADLRFTNYYMDLEVNFSPIAITEGIEEDCYDHSTTSTQVFVDGVTVYGHRLFGLPPVEPTYVCNWDFNIGDVNGECTVEFVRTLGLALRAFSLSFDDDENALSVASANNIHDITFLRARLEPIMILLHVDEVVVLLQLKTISLDFNDWARAKYSERLSIVIPDIVLACVEQKSTARHRAHSQPLVMHAYFQTSIELTMIERNLHLAREREMQQDHIQQHDRRTRRTDFLINADYDSESSARIPPKHINPPAMPFPPMPEPTSRQDTSSLNLNSDRSAETVQSMPARNNSRKSSSISLTSSARSQPRSIVRTKSVLSKPVSSDSKPDVYYFHSGQHFQSRDATTSQSEKPTPLNMGSLELDPLSRNVTTSEMAPSNVTFFSSYMSPSMPLNMDDLDLKDVPVLPPLVDLNQNNNIDTVPFNDLLGYDQEEDAVHTGFIVNLDSGFRAYCNPEAVHCVARLTGTIQPHEPLDLLDSYQVDVMKEVTDYEKQKAIMGTTVEVSLKVPHAHVRFAHSVQGSRLTQSNDQYDIELSRLVLTSRCKTGTRSQEGAGSTKQVSTIHALLRSFAFSATERSGKSLHQHAAIQVNLEDLIFWAVSDQALLADLQFRGLEVTTASKEVEYLAPLIHRAAVLRDHVDCAFSKVAAENQMRLRYLAFSLTMAGGDVADPLFLTRPSYILRSTDNHLRTHDSWKIISRFRYIYQCLPKTGKDSLSSQILDGACRCPLDAESRIISSLDPWRSWDLNYLKKSYAIQKIYGSLEGVEELHQSIATPITISLKTGEIRLIIDPGPKQNELALEAVAVGVTIDVPRRGTNLASEEYPSAENITLIQAHFKKAAIRLNWELCELVENIIKLYNEGAVGVDSESTTVRSTTTTISTARHHYHLIISTDSGVIALDTINLKYVSVSKGLKSSFLFTDRRRVEEGVLASLLLNADIASTELVSHSKVISILTFRLPSIYISYDGQILEGSSVNFWNIALSNQDLSFQIIEDLVGLVEVADLVLQDEVAYINDLINHQPARVSLQPPRLLISDQQRVNKFNVAIFSDVYQVRIALLSTLTYVISGTVARSSVAARRGCELVFDFDLGGHSQQIESSSYSGLESIPELQLPPVNGRITLRHTEEVTVVELTVTVEIIVFDGAALHGLVDILQQPEISNIVRDIRADSFVIKSRINKLFGSPAKPGDSNRSHDPKPLIYGAHVTIAGLGVQVGAPGTIPDGPTADLLFKLGCVQTTATNKSEQHAGILKYPDIHIRLRQVKFELSSSTGAATQPYGNVRFAAFVSCTSKQNASGDPIRAYLMKSDALDIQLFAETASTIIDVIVNLQNRLIGLDLSKEVRNLRRLRHRRPHIDLNDTDASESNAENLALDHGSSILFNSIYSFEILNVQVCWIVGNSPPASPGRSCEDLVLSLRKIHLATKKENAARLMIEDLQLQMVPTSESKHERSSNSALLPEVVFNVANLSTKEDRRFAFQAAGKSLDLRLTSQFVLPARDLQSSIATASEKLRFASASWMATSTKTGSERKSLLSNKRLASLLIDADFAGASVYIQGRKVIDRQRSTFSMLRGGRSPQHGRYGQFTTEDASSSTTLRSPGVAFKVEYKDDGLLDPALNAEIKVDASTNVLYPTVVPLVLEISSSVREIVQEPKQDQLTPKSKAPSQLLQDENLLTADPSAILGRTKLNLGLRICKQEFSLSCQPIARVAAIARFQDIYITANTVRSIEHGHFFAISAAFTRPQASVQHVYSRESTGNLEVESLVLSLMNSRHLNGTSGISAILKISPTKLQINAKQLQDFLLFREIWVPPEIRQARPAPAHERPLEPQAYFAQRYQQVAAAGAFPWNATIAVAELDIEVDLGQALGKSTLKIVNFWVSSKKTSDWEQNLCLGFDRIIINSTGRMSGFVDLQRFKVRTSIQWPAREKALNQTPLIQASLGFGELRTKAAFDYQAFLITDITSFEFLMYNVRDASKEKGDRLVAILDGDKVQVFSTTQSASQGLALYQAFVRLIEERRTAYETSLRDIEKFLRRKSTLIPMATQLSVGSLSVKDDHAVKTPISLHTDVVVTLKAITVGAFPGTFFDNQIFKLEALAAQARFAVIVEEGKIHSGLGLTLGQFRIALAAVKRPNVPKTLGEVDVNDVVGSAVDAGGGTILRVPKLVATMQTWQSPQSNHIDFIFKSSFEGKVDVGWNYARISFIRGMWTSHARALAHRLGKPLPQQSAVKITGGPQPEQDGKQRQPSTGEQEKITAVVNVPQSKYKYAALEPPIIETPQLRDMGEATPPLEWIGLNRERLPNLTHQIVIVALLEIAKEVEDAYSRILGSS
ncbi:MAG: hypothetical protein M1836_005822 [Candelina mexicana]|nr:MAG: hypothetical protein M1836_005822 [Candelina mexicana]